MVWVRHSSTRTQPTGWARMPWSIALARVRVQGSTPCLETRFRRRDQDRGPRSPATAQPKTVSLALRSMRMADLRSLSITSRACGGQVCWDGPMLVTHSIPEHAMTPCSGIFVLERARTSGSPCLPWWWGWVIIPPLPPPLPMPFHTPRANPVLRMLHKSRSCAQGLAVNGVASQRRITHRASSRRPVSFPVLSAAAPPVKRRDRQVLVRGTARRSSDPGTGIGQGDLPERPAADPARGDLS